MEQFIEYQLRDGRWSECQLGQGPIPLTRVKLGLRVSPRAVPGLNKPTQKIAHNLSERGPQIVID